MNLQGVYVREWLVVTGAIFVFEVVFVFVVRRLGDFLLAALFSLFLVRCTGMGADLSRALDCIAQPTTAGCR